jgi:anti-sigma-K factor RskA
MSDTPEIKRNDPMLAAEYSLGLLEGEDLMAARAKDASGGIFTSRKDWWDNWFIPLTDEMDGCAPDSAVWDRIDAQINSGEANSSAEVITLKTRLRNWQVAGTAAAMAAVAALAVVVIGPSGTDTPASTAGGETQLAAQAPLMANIPIGDTQLRIGVTYLPDAEEMLVSASGLTADGVHDHELWLVPADGSDLQSLGVVVPGEERRIALPVNITGNMGSGVQLVLTREPIGGKPEGQDAGPVVAEGTFNQV